MGLTPTYYIADFQSGDLIDVLPLESVSLKSTLTPATFSASLDMRKTGRSMSEARALLALLKNGKRTLVPILEGLSTGAGNPPTSRALGEWWISKVEGSYRDPVVSLGGPEFAGYSEHAVLVENYVGMTLDPVVTMRAMLSDLFSKSQNVIVDLQDWVSHTGAKVEVDARVARSDYWSAIQDLTGAVNGPFEWIIRTGLVTAGWVPTRVTRTLEVGQPTLAFPRPGITLEITGPGNAPASLVDASWGWDEATSASTVYGWGAGSGDDQVGEAFASRPREADEPVKTRTVSDPAAMSMNQLNRSTRAALRRYSPEDRALPATMPVDRYTPRVGEVYEWRSDATWTRPAESGDVLCAGWSWSSGQPDVYSLDLVRS